ncbi:hypothetical protein GCM10007170_41400 [Arthrobacter liuii]|uniref:Uncharacterized protein n=1 Tax=Arthrobacter liuii TaxID=1476996 RepID=A0ABQ2B0D6_9MICC|nr:hypothetical protein GCM10007170_41400 [Arthrobacter liuii]
MKGFIKGDHCIIVNAAGSKGWAAGAGFAQESRRIGTIAGETGNVRGRLPLGSSVASAVTGG